MPLTNLLLVHPKAELGKTTPLCKLGLKFAWCVCICVCVYYQCVSSFLFGREETHSLLRTRLRNWPASWRQSEEIIAYSQHQGCSILNTTQTCYFLSPSLEIRNCAFFGLFAFLGGRPRLSNSTYSFSEVELNTGNINPKEIYEKWNLKYNNCYCGPSWVVVVCRNCLVYNDQRLVRFNKY